LNRSKLPTFSLFVFFTFLIFPSLYPKDETAVVIGSGLRMRKEPNTQSTVIGSLNKGDLVRIQTKKNREKIGENNSFWYEIKHENKRGWVYGAYLHMNPHINLKNNTVVWTEEHKNEHMKRNMFIKRPGMGIVTIKYWEPSLGFELSQTFQFVAIDDGTDMVGTLTIYDTYNGEQLYSESYPRNLPKWNGETIIIEEVYHVGNGCFLWREVIFDNGTIKQGKKTGESGYHYFSGDDGLCEKYNKEHYSE
jgi:hypothetical protein